MKTTCPRRMVVSSLAVLLACQVGVARAGELRDKLKGKLSGFTETSAKAMKEKVKSKVQEKLSSMKATSTDGLKAKLKDKVNGFKETSATAFKDKVKDGLKGKLNDIKEQSSKDLKEKLTALGQGKGSSGSAGKSDGSGASTGTDGGAGASEAGSSQGSGSGTGGAGTAGASGSSGSGFVEPCPTSVDEPVDADVATTASTGPSTPAITEETTIKLKVGRTYSFEGKAFGEKSGRVVLEFGELIVPLQIDDWTTEEVSFTVPMLQLKKPAKATLHVTTAEQKPIQSVTVKVFPGKVEQAKAE